MGLAFTHRLHLPTSQGTTGMTSRKISGVGRTWRRVLVESRVGIRPTKLGCVRSVGSSHWGAGETVNDCADSFYHHDSIRKGHGETGHRTGSREHSFKQAFQLTKR